MNNEEKKKKEPMINNYNQYLEIFFTYVLSINRCLLECFWSGTFLPIRHATPNIKSRESGLVENNTINYEIFFKSCGRAFLSDLNHFQLSFLRGFFQPLWSHVLESNLGFFSENTAFPLMVRLWQLDFSEEHFVSCVRVADKPKRLPLLYQIPCWRCSQ